MSEPTLYTRGWVHERAARGLVALRESDAEVVAEVLGSLADYPAESEGSSHPPKIREYRNDWIGEHFPLETRYGVVTIQPLGWGVRVETRRDHGYEDPPLRINNADVRLAWYDVPLDAEAKLRAVTWPAASLRKTTGYGWDDASASAHEKMEAELPPLVEAWLAVPEHWEAYLRTREAYVSNQARTCEESIAELEAALAVYRERLVRIEAGDLSVSPYLNGGKGIVVDEKGGDA